VLRFSAVVPQATGLRQMARRLVDTAFGGSAEGLVMTLLEGGDLTEGESRAHPGEARKGSPGEEGRIKP